MKEANRYLSTIMTFVKRHGLAILLVVISIEIGWLISTITLSERSTSKPSHKIFSDVGQETLAKTINPTQTKKRIYLVQNIYKSEAVRLHLVMFYDKTLKKNVIKLVDKSIYSNGNPMKSYDRYATIDYLFVKVFNHNNLIDSFKTGHPLYPHVEIYPDKHHPNFENRKIKLDSGHCFINMQWKPNLSIVIYEKTEKISSRKKLATIKL